MLARHDSGNSRHVLQLSDRQLCDELQRIGAVLAAVRHHHQQHKDTTQATATSARTRQSTTTTQDVVSALCALRGVVHEAAVLRPCFVTALQHSVKPGLLACLADGRYAVLHAACDVVVSLATLMHSACVLRSSPLSRWRALQRSSSTWLLPALLRVTASTSPRRVAVVRGALDALITGSSSNNSNDNNNNNNNAATTMTTTTAAAAAVAGDDRTPLAHVDGVGALSSEAMATLLRMCAGVHTHTPHARVRVHALQTLLLLLQHTCGTPAQLRVAQYSRVLARVVCSGCRDASAAVRSAARRLYVLLCRIEPMCAADVYASLPPAAQQHLTPPPAQRAHTTATRPSTRHGRHGGSVDVTTTASLSSAALFVRASQPLQFVCAVGDTATALRDDLRSIRAADARRRRRTTTATAVPLRRHRGRQRRASLSLLLPSSSSRQQQRQHDSVASRSATVTRSAASWHATRVVMGCDDDDDDKDNYRSSMGDSDDDDDNNVAYTSKRDTYTNMVYDDSDDVDNDDDDNKDDDTAVLARRRLDAVTCAATAGQRTRALVRLRHALQRRPEWWVAERLQRPLLPLLTRCARESSEASHCVRCAAWAALRVVCVSSVLRLCVARQLTRVLQLCRAGDDDAFVEVQLHAAQVRRCVLGDAAAELSPWCVYVDDKADATCDAGGVASPRVVPPLLPVDLCLNALAACVEQWQRGRARDEATAGRLHWLHDMRRLVALTTPPSSSSSAAAGKPSSLTRAVARRVLALSQSLSTRHPAARVRHAATALQRAVSLLLSP